MDKMNKNDRLLCVPYINQSTVTECGEEFTLPDYYPEVRRVVSTLCRVLPESLYTSGEFAEEGGVVAFTVLYLGDDGSLTAVPLTTDYTVSIRIPEDGCDGTVISADTMAENVTCRATGPRRLALRARLRTSLIGDCRRDVSPEIVMSDQSAPFAAEKISVQSLEKTVPSICRFIGKVTGTVDGELHEKAGTKPVMCDGEISVNEAVIRDGGVTLRGDAMLWCICFGTDGLYYKATAKSPFEEHIVLEGDVPVGGSARGFGRCASVGVKQLDDGNLVWDMEYDLECEVIGSTDVIVTEDMYSTMWIGDCRTVECTPLSLGACHTGRLSLNGSVKRNGGTTSDYVIGSFGKAVCDRTEINGSRIAFSGTAEVRAVICGGGEAAEECIRIPFKYEYDCGGMDDGDMIWRCDASVIECVARLEGGEITVTAELFISFSAMLKIPVSYVSRLEIERGQGVSRGAGEICVYYPAEGESAWDITKKYHIPKSAVCDVSFDGVLIE